ncbi:MAG: hypothetical protein JXR37_33290 [Kiritimatiellae bacterium]|nr:hypothetical protein [Kiritimatiellia bacterium]
MKKVSWQVWLGVVFVALSAALYGVHFLIFREAHHIFIYLLGDIAFVPVEVLLVTVVIHQLLQRREKRNMLRKLNMVIGAFFSEVGTALLKQCAAFIDEPEQLQAGLERLADWSERRFRRSAQQYRAHAFAVDAQRGSLEQLHALLGAKREFLLRLLENPNLLEHESFTELLWAVFHLGEELAARRRLAGLSLADYGHLAGDITRVQGLLVGEWLVYLAHLKRDYPYLFSLAVRTNPFDAQAGAETG